MLKHIENRIGIESFSEFAQTNCEFLADLHVRFKYTLPRISQAAYLLARFLNISIHKEVRNMGALQPDPGGSVGSSGSTGDG